MLVVHSDTLDATPHVVVLPLTTELRDAPLYRITIAPTRGNGLDELSQISVDRPFIAQRDRLRRVIGRADDATMLQVNRSLLVLLGMA